MQYNTYIKSESWKQRRQEKLQHRNYCQICRSTEKLHIHHKHYRTFEKENPTDLITLCASCHALLHRHIGHSVKKINKKICRIRRLLELGVVKNKAFWIVSNDELYESVYIKIC
jgi:hypothetical protein